MAGVQRSSTPYRGLVREAQDGKFQAEDIDEVQIQQYLYTHDLPDPDLLDSNQRRNAHQ